MPDDDNRAFPEREECPLVPESEKIPLDTDPIAGGTPGVGDLTSLKMPRPVSPLGWSSTGNVTPPGETADGSATQQVDVLIYNDTGADLPTLSVVGIDDPHTLPSTNEEAYVTRPVFDGSTPDIEEHLRRFAVTQEPIKSERIGRGVLSGPSVVKLNVLDELHEYADIEDGVSTRLESTTSGAARILWKAPGTGEQWAFVLLGASPVLPAVWEATSDESGGEITARRIDSTGALVGEEVTFTVLPA